MSDKFKDIYRIPTARAEWWDYTNPGLYFITICTHGHECYLGKIRDDEMHLSTIGEIAKTCWKEIPNHFPFVNLHTMVVMPNHVHGILEILPGALVETLQPSTETLHATSLHSPYAKNEKMAAITPPKGSLASIIRSYKSAVSKKAHPINRTFDWQARYYDNIIRNLPAYQLIEAYIENNVGSWNRDQFFKK